MLHDEQTAWAGDAAAVAATASRMAATGCLMIEGSLLDRRRRLVPVLLPDCREGEEGDAFTASYTEDPSVQNGSSSRTGLSSPRQWSDRCCSGPACAGSALPQRG